MLMSTVLRESNVMSSAESDAFAFTEQSNAYIDMVKQYPHKHPQAEKRTHNTIASFLTAMQRDAKDCLKAKTGFSDSKPWIFVADMRMYIDYQEELGFARTQHGGRGVKTISRDMLAKWSHVLNSPTTAVIILSRR